MSFQHDDHIRGHWLPRNHADMKPWIERRLKKARQRKAGEYNHAVVEEFKNLIERDADIYMGFTQMFAALPQDPPPQVPDYKMMLSLFDVILGEAPEFTESTVVAIPITAILLGPMNTLAGFNMFSNDRVNAMIKKMLGVWCHFLTTPDSRSVLTSDANGWFGPNATEAIPNFPQTYICDPEAPFYGFKSWDDFFTRLFRPGVRRVQFPEDGNIVNSACEVTVFRIQPNVQARDQFWIKGHPYSLLQMLNNDRLAPQFVGGTVWQAFLSALNYHRWHAPVDGKIVKTVMVPGTYYLQAIDALEVNQTHTPNVKAGETPGPAPDLLDRSQDFITQLAARCLVFIEADNPKIGLMCFIAVGMVEVSSCELTVKAGDRVKKGEQIGMFHFGGSTSCLVFRKETNITFSNDYPVHAKVPLSAAIGYVQ
ncbi:phosphatidylserine decarboxylase-like protein [Cristinia sonorae]|uniref:Phosphatidylserine decarboxylase-like protein n=1 Tax=Cristinia sonorae TaxID=1940300 RepID=A0A8K0UT12_9AGAR|nr:phosphatidylserine decarboxylase-like protein [Cristinia sonorae]